MRHEQFLNKEASGEQEQPIRESSVLQDSGEAALLSGGGVHTILGCEGSFAQSKTVVFGAPYDSTTSFRPGTRFASASIRTESWGLETYSPYQDRDMADYFICDAGDLELPFGAPEPALDMIQRQTAGILDAGKRPVMIGGEHLVTLGAVRAAAAVYPGLHIVHFDAHADLREEYLGQSLSHATVLRRCHDIVGDGRIFQFGIRSGDREEFRWGSGHVRTCKFNFDTLEETVDQLTDMPVYLTLDLDVLDPSVFPGTGTPEPGGVTFLQLLEALQMLAPLHIVAADVNELCPPCDPTGASTAAACKVIRELLLMLEGCGA